jgi:uncharacterized repeat protein (TIGR04138 family)
MQEVNFEEMVEQLVTHDPRFAREAYHFTRDALEFTQRLVNRENKSTVRHHKEAPNHVTGQELLEGIRQFALQQYGPMTVTVLEEWGVRNCRDFGEIVFNMVESTLLKKTEKDTRDDFQNSYDFTDAFRKPFWPQGRLDAAKKPTAVESLPPALKIIPPQS